MVATGQEDQFVQQLEIVVVVRQQAATESDCAHQMAGIGLADRCGVCRRGDVVPPGFQEPDQDTADGVVVNVELHDDRSAAHSCGVKILGLGLYL